MDREEKFIFFKGVKNKSKYIWREVKGNNFKLYELIGISKEKDYRYV